MAVSLIESDIGGRTGVWGRDDKNSMQHAEGEGLAGHLEADVWEREEHMGLELRKEQRKFCPVLEWSPSSSVTHRAYCGVPDTWFWEIAG